MSGLVVTFGQSYREQMLLALEANNLRVVFEKFMRLVGFISNSLCHCIIRFYSCLYWPDMVLVHDSDHEWELPSLATLERTLARPINEGGSPAAGSLIYKPDLAWRPSVAQEAL